MRFRRPRAACRAFGALALVLDGSLHRAQLPLGQRRVRLQHLAELPHCQEVLVRLQGLLEGGVGELSGGPQAGVH